MILIDIVNRYVCPMASLATFDTFVGNTSQTASDLRAAMLAAGEEIMSRAEWSQLYAAATITNGSASYTVPTDFHRVVQGNTVHFSATPFTPIPYIRSADVWSQLTVQSSSQPYFTIKNGTLIFLPALTAQATFRYMRKTWNGEYSLTGPVIPTDELATDNDEPYIPARLLGLCTLWRYRRAKGLSWQDYADEYEAMLASEIKADRGIS
jgi:hypothetical protein